MKRQQRVLLKLHFYFFVALHQNSGEGPRLSISERLQPQSGFTLEGKWSESYNQTIIIIISLSPKLRQRQRKACV